MTGFHPTIANPDPLPPFLCKATVTRAYYGMLESGAARESALGVAVKVYQYHNPAGTVHKARSEVERWLGVQILQ
jgi:hypothetical protein